jgi:hypothetical protein
MSITAIRNALFTHLTACGPWAAREISTCSFDVIESTNGACAITFFPEGPTQIEPLTYGRSNVVEDKVQWRIGGTLWLRDEGDPTRVLSRIWQGYDDLLTTLRKDNSLGGTAQAAFLVQISQRTMEFKSIGGHVWKPIDWVLLATEF